MTLAKIQEMANLIAELPKLPPYYRVNQRTFDYLRSKLPGDTGTIENYQSFSGVRIHIDPTVPDGDALPPEGWKP